MEKWLGNVQEYTDLYRIDQALLQLAPKAGFLRCGKPETGSLTYRTDTLQYGFIGVAVTLLEGHGNQGRRQGLQQFIRLQQEIGILRTAVSLMPLHESLVNQHAVRFQR